MSTSPSWFDQEKFSRLVKKVGTRLLPEVVPGQPGAEPENRSPSGEGQSSTARISLVSKPPSLLAEQRALPALPRRTTPLPTLNALFSQPASPHAASPSGQSSSGGADSTPKAEPGPGAATENFPGNQEGEEMAAVWQKMTQLNEELAHALQERDQAVQENVLLRDQL